MKEYSADELIANHANITADVMHGKNLDKHLIYLNNLISIINYSVDQHVSEGKDTAVLLRIGFNSYSLRDEILRQLNPIDLMKSVLEECRMTKDLEDVSGKVDLNNLDANAQALITMHHDIMQGLNKFGEQVLLKLEKALVPKKEQNDNP